MTSLKSTSSPLGRHRRRDSWKRSTTILPSVGRRCLAPHPAVPTVHQLCGLEFGQTFEPEARCFCLPMSKHPRLDNLVGLAPAGRHHTDGVLNGEFLGSSERQKKLRGYILSLYPVLRCLEPSRARDSEKSTRGMSNYQVPLLSRKHFDGVSLNMLSWNFCGQEIAGPRIMASHLESLTNNAGKFTRHEYAHASPSFASGVSSVYPWAEL